MIGGAFSATVVVVVTIVLIVWRFCFNKGQTCLARQQNDLPLENIGSR